MLLAAFALPLTDPVYVFSVLLLLIALAPGTRSFICSCLTFGILFAVGVLLPCS